MHLGAIVKGALRRDSVEPYQPEGYNPEAPAMTTPSTRQPFWAAPPPTGVPPGTFPLPPGALNVPPPAPRQRDLVPVRTLDEDEEDKGENTERCMVFTSGISAASAVYAGCFS